MRSQGHTLAQRAARLTIVAAALLLGGCEKMVVMNPTGDIATQQRNLILAATGLMLLIIVPVMVLTVLFAWRYRRGNPNKTYDPNFDHSTSLELVIWSCPLMIIIILGGITWVSTHLLDPFRPLDRVAPGRPVAANARPLEIQVVAMDWKWLFIYPGQNIATVNELVLPTDVPVRFSITSTSQFNTFYAPTLAGMIYAMPGMQSMLNAVINKPGDSWGYSGNYTGRGYSDMRFRLHGVAPAEFDRWVAQVKGGGGSLATADYIRLEQPSEKVPVLRFGSVAPQLFDRVLNRCVEPGKPCMVDVMARDRRMGGGDPSRLRVGEGVPPGREAAPLNGEKPVPALEKAPEDKGSGPNVTKPVEPGAPGQLKPGDQRNRGLTAADPLHLPGALRAARA